MTNDECWQRVHGQSSGIGVNGGGFWETEFMSGGPTVLTTRIFFLLMPPYRSPMMLSLISELVLFIFFSCDRCVLKV